jgi:hypothetical protein
MFITLTHIAELFPSSNLALPEGGAKRWMWASIAVEQLLGSG